MNPPRRRRRGALRWLLLLALFAGFWLLRPRPAPVETVVDTQAVCAVQYSSRPVPSPPAISAASAILIDPDTGTVFYQKDAHGRRPMASTTKIMTAVVLLEHSRPEEMVTASKDCPKVPPASLFLRPGERLTVKDLLAAMLLRSANDSCVAAAEHVAGTEQAFVAMMNAKAAALGLKDTHYVNPHGLNADGHYSSAYDLAQLARYALHNSLFTETVARKSVRISRSMNNLDVVMVNKNRLLFRWDAVDGIKTGYTKQAGNCLVASATQNGWRLLAVVLKSGDSWADSRALLEHGFRQYEHILVAKKETLLTPVRVIGGVKANTEAVEARDIAMVVPRGTKVGVHTRVTAGIVHAPVYKGEPLGMLKVYRGNTEIGSSPLLAVNAVEATPRISVVSSILVGLGTLLGLMVLTAGAWYGRKIAQGSGRRRRSVSPRS